MRVVDVEFIKVISQKGIEGAMEHYNKEKRSISDRLRRLAKAFPELKQLKDRLLPSNRWTKKEDTLLVTLSSQFDYTHEIASHFKNRTEAQVSKRLSYLSNIASNKKTETNKLDALLEHTVVESFEAMKRADEERARNSQERERLIGIVKSTPRTHQLVHIVTTPTTTADTLLPQVQPITPTNNVNGPRITDPTPTPPLPPPQISTPRPGDTFFQSSFFRQRDIVSPQNFPSLSSPVRSNKNIESDSDNEDDSYYDAQDD